MRPLVDRSGDTPGGIGAGMYFLNIDYLLNGKRLAFIKAFRSRGRAPAITANARRLNCAPQEH